MRKASVLPHATFPSVAARRQRVAIPQPRENRVRGLAETILVKNLPGTRHGILTFYFRSPIAHSMPFSKSC